MTVADQTPVYGLRYQELSDPPDGADLGENLALDVESELVRIEQRITTNQNDIADAQADIATNAVAITALDGRIDTLEHYVETERTATSASFTAETVVDSVTATLVNGRRYRITWMGKIQSTVADGYARCRIREDSILGTQRQSGQLPTNVAANQSFELAMTARYTATASGNKTFVFTAQRQAGTGNLSSFADPTAPTYFWVEPVPGT
jgi:hypothetical protein